MQIVEKDSNWRLTFLILLSPPTLLSVLKIINGLFQFGLNARVPEKNYYKIMLADFFCHQPVRCFWSWGGDKQGEGICFGVFASVWWVRVGGREDRGENLKFSQLLLCLRIVFIEGIVRGLTCQNLWKLSLNLCEKWWIHWYFWIFLSRLAHLRNILHV